MSGTCARREDEPLLRGEGRFVGDLRVPGLLHAAIVRSPYASGQLHGVELRAALRASGVVDAFAAADVVETAPIPSRVPIPRSLEPLLQPVLARGEVRYVGQPVAVVVADTADAARDAADLVEVRVGPTEPEPDVVVHSEANGHGSVEDEFDRADVVVRETFTVARQCALPLETRGLLVDVDPATGVLTIWTAAKAPRQHRDVIVSQLRLSPDRVRYAAVDAGGGFGVRGELHPEDILVPLAAQRVGRPVRWLEQRLEHLQSAYQSRDLGWTAAIGVAADGRILALDARVRSDIGAFLGPNGITVGRVAAKALHGPYRVAATRCRVDVVRSAKPPLGTMRGPGHVEAAFVRERLVDLAAARLGIDAVELRRRNLVRADEMPYDTGVTGVVLDGGDYVDGLERVVAATGGRAGRRGFGVSCVVEGSGTPGVETASARRERDGRVTVEVGSSSFGQGHAGAFGRIAAAALDADPTLVDVIEANTDEIGTGGGSFASRTTIMAGSAVHEAATALRAALEDAPDDAVVEARGTFSASGQSFTFGAASAVVAVDDETGTITLRELAIAADAGAALDRDGVHGQLAGGGACGVGGALFEHVAFDAGGAPLTASLRDYHVPLALDLPAIRTIVLESPTTLNPLGVRGVGEVAVSAAAAAVANAVADTGSRAASLPLTPEATLVRREVIA